METKHTPGPWEIKGSYIMAGKVCTASPHGPVGTYDDVNEEHQANARLIAAAPDLLATLKHESSILIESIRITSSISERIWLEGIHSRMQKAIAKATGE